MEIAQRFLLHCNDDQREVILKGTVAEADHLFLNRGEQFGGAWRNVAIANLNQSSLSKFLFIRIHRFGYTVGIKHQPVPGIQLKPSIFVLPARKYSQRRSSFPQWNRFTRFVEQNGRIVTGGGIGSTRYPSYRSCDSRTHAAKNQKGFTPSPVRSASGELVPS